MLRDSGVRFLTCDMPEANDLTVGITALVAQQAREAISRRTREALVAAKPRGVKLETAPRSPGTPRCAPSLWNSMSMGFGLGATADGTSRMCRTC